MIGQRPTPRYRDTTGSSDQQDKTWTHVLTSLAAHFGISGQVQSHRVCLDPQLQWSQAGNIWKNAGVRTVFYLPVALVKKMLGRRNA